MKRTLALAAVLVVIAGANLVFLQSMKVMHGSGGPAVSIAPGTHSANYTANALLYPTAKEFVSPDGYINTSATTTLGYLINGQHNVVLLDFWTYSLHQLPAHYFHIWKRGTKIQRLWARYCRASRTGVLNLKKCWQCASRRAEIWYHVPGYYGQ